jgi:hypothetical protein
MPCAWVVVMLSWRGVEEELSRDMRDFLVCFLSASFDYLYMLLTVVLGLP